MGAKKTLRPSRAALLGNRNLFQKGPSRRQCVSPRCKAVVAQAERYRTLNEELIRENAALRAAEKSNREFSVMFDRFLLKMGQSIPYVQGIKKHLEAAYDNLGQVETMIDCFADGNSLRKFLLGEESFTFEPVQTDAKDSAPSPIVKQAPPREHRRFDEEGEMNTIVEADEENVAMNCTQPDKSLIRRPSTHCFETPAIPQRRSSRRSSIGIPVATARAFADRSHQKISPDSRANPSLTTSSKSPPCFGGSDQRSSEERTESRPQSSSNHILRSPPRRVTYVKVSEIPRVLVTDPEARVGTLQEVEQSNRKNENYSLPQIPGKSDAELTRLSERTMDETKLLGVETRQINEKSPTAINVAQIWAKANALSPLARFPTHTTASAALLGPPGSDAATAVDSLPTSPLMNSLSTTQFPSPVLCEKESSLPTSTPAVNKVDSRPTALPEVSIIVANNTDVEPTVVRNVDCRRRKPILKAPRESSPQFSTAIPKSTRFSGVPDDCDAKDQTVTKSALSKASVSSPFVKRARNTKVRPQKACESEEAHEEEVSGVGQSANSEFPRIVVNEQEKLDAEEPGTSSQSVPRKTFVKKKATSKPLTQARKRTQRHSSKVDSVNEAGQHSNFTENNSTVTGDNMEPPTPKRVRVTAEQTREAPRISVQRPSSSRVSREISSSVEEASTEPRRLSRRAVGKSYAEPSLRTKMRRD